MFNLLKKSIYVKFLLLTALLGAGLYLVSSSPATRAADNDWLLTWSSNSYVPLGYEGRALPSRGSQIKVTAMPTKKLAQNPDALYYRWLLDNEIMYSAQGTGKSSFQFRVTKWGGDSHEIESQILDNQENIIWRGFLSIKIVSPQVLLKTPGSYYAFVDSVSSKTGKNLVLTALPFFFQAQKLTDLIFNWAVDGQTLSALDEKNPDQLTIKIPAGDLSESIFKNLSLSVQNKTDELQQLTVNFSLEIK
ncbi:hypothetical protein KKF25_02165 [Patescibacteria group bacterium]|nr:hypothetical protein [Patescibacteria group bacterium]